VLRAALIFTLDYELFGDGSGTTLREQVVPTAHLANVLELNGARLTLFVEVGQQIYFRRHGLKDQYQPVEDQLRELVQRGHDVQLHVHPMWFFAGPPRAGRAALDASIFDLSLLAPEVIDDIVNQGCAYLREVLRPVAPAIR
jgi:hypothetical protein